MQQAYVSPWEAAAAAGNGEGLGEQARRGNGGGSTGEPRRKADLEHEWELEEVQEEERDHI